MTVAEAYAKWQTEYWTVSGNLLENTIRGYLSIYKKHLLPIIGNCLITAIDFDTLQVYYNNLCNNGISPKTIRNINQALDSLLNWCFFRKLIPAEPSKSIVLPKKRGQNTVCNVLSEDEWITVRPYIMGHYRLALLFLVETGIRSEEIAIQKSNIDFNKKLLYIRTATKRSYTDYENRKTTLIVSEYLKSKAAYRSIPITPYVKYILYRQANMLQQKHIKSDYIFCNSKGGIIDTRNLLRAFHTALKKAGLQPRGLNSLRKLYIKRMVKNSMDPKILQKIVGHEEYSTTMKYYLNISDEDKICEAMRIYHKMYIDNL